ncbi:hypothetical protein [Methylobacterium sp. J-090]|uniref:hypothetical protein n=1 Tax=Methylobacterium sp. J-090 TaxID=2836666 RepID=UPI001FBB4D7E|nr:hypothetical protein [Methylobacterium sp. J-090]MCJ2081920.1 hypothetical protein [Methylobacterium sp. J-090]
MNTRIGLLLVGLLVGGLVGYLTRPQAAEIRIGDFSLEVQGDKPAGTGGGSLTTGQMQHIGIFGVIGAALGLGAGFVAGRGRA